MDRSSAQESYETPVQHASNVLELSAAFAFVSRLRLSDARFVAACLLAGVHPLDLSVSDSALAEAESVHRATVGRVRKRLIDNGLTFSAQHAIGTCCAPVAPVVSGSVPLPGELLADVLRALVDLSRGAVVAQHVAGVAQNGTCVAQVAGVVAQNGVSGTAAPCVEGGVGGGGVLGAESVEGSNHVKPIKQGTKKRAVARAVVSANDIALPAQLESDVARSAVARWLEYKAGRRQSYKDPSHLVRVIAMACEDFPHLTADDLSRSVDRSIGQGYQGLVIHPKNGGFNGKDNTSGSRIRGGKDGGGAAPGSKNGTDYAAAAARREYGSGAG